MRLPCSIRIALCLYAVVPGGAIAAVSASAQTANLTQAKPSAALPLNTAPASAAASTTRPSVPTPAQRPARRAEVSFSQGQLAVSADNASLNQILREIGRQTGIAITGGVAEERVFGKYGPAPTPDLLATLLDGTGSNMLFIQGEPGSKGQLILTPRQGGPTPPNPNAPGFDDDLGSDNEAGQQQRSRPNQGVNLFGDAPAGQAAPGNGLPASATDPSNPTGAPSQQSPNGIKTPQEIFQQLQQLRLQQQQQQTPPQP